MRSIDSERLGNSKMTGLGSDESKTFVDFMNERDNLTAQKTGVGNAGSQIDNFIRGAQPLLGVAGAGAVAAPWALSVLQNPPPAGPVQSQ